MKKIESISVISSSICNLNCSFCYLHSNQAYKEFHKLVHEAWNNGTYLKNIEQTLNSLGYSPLEITHFQLWGGETLLGIIDISNNLTEIYELFPHIEKWSLSTNFTKNIEEFVNFLIELNKIANPNTNIFLQLSIDGPPGEFTEQGHNGKWEIYQDNLLKFTSLINNIKLENLTINLVIHSTINKDLYLKTFTNYDNMKNYMQYMYNFLNTIKQSCISASFRVEQNFVYPTMATPYNDTSEDGKKYALALKLWDEVYQKEFSNLIRIAIPNFSEGTGMFDKDQPYIKGNLECGEGKSALTINYDGSLCECNGSFIHYFQPYLNEFNNEKYKNEYQEAIIHNKMSYFNPINKNDKDIERQKWAVHQGGYRYNNTTYIHMLMSLGKQMAKSGQILSKYQYDETLLFKHCWILLDCLSCSRNNIAETHIPYLTPVGALRRYLNGAMDIIYEKQITLKRLKNNIIILDKKEGVISIDERR